MLNLRGWAHRRSPSWSALFAEDDWGGGAGLLTIAWLASMLAMPIAQWFWGEPALLTGVVVTVLLQAGLALLFLARAGGTARAVRVGVTVALLAWVAEAVGSATGLPFGSYHYTARLWPQIAAVPILIPLAWLMMLPPAWAVAQRLSWGRSRARFVVISAAAFTAWDLYLDPQMVHWGLWVWDVPGSYFGIPLINFAGWVLVSALITTVARPPMLMERPLIAIYTLTWLTEAVGLSVFWGLWGPALVGFLGMGIFVLVSWRRGLQGN